METCPEIEHLELPFEKLGPDNEIRGNMRCCDTDDRSADVVLHPALIPYGTLDEVDRLSSRMMTPQRKMNSFICAGINSLRRLGSSQRCRLFILIKPLTVLHLSRNVFFRGP